MLTPPMRRVPYSIYMLPGLPGKRPHASRFKMSEARAAELRAVGIVANTTEWRDEPETEEERQRMQFAYQSAGRESVKPPRA